MNLCALFYSVMRFLLILVFLKEVAVGKIKR